MVWQSSTNEDTAFPWWYDEGTPLSRTCPSFSFWTWQAAKPRTAPSFFFDFVYVCRNLNSLWFYSTGLSFCSISKLSAGLWIGNFRTGLLSTFRIFLHWISDGYFVEDSLFSWSCLVLHVWDSVPNWSDDGSISCLVCVYVCARRGRTSKVGF